MGCWTLHRKASAALLLALAAGCAARSEHGRGASELRAESPVTSSMYDAAQRITPALLHEQIRALASDAFEGRGPASEGGERAMQYLEQQLKWLGFEPAAPDGSYRQPFELVGVTTAPLSGWTFRGARDAVTLAPETFVAVAGDQRPSAHLADAELVFVGYGIEAPEFGWDDFKGHDVRGKVLVMLNDDPDWDPALFGGNTRLYYGRWTYKYESAARHGAAGAIIVHTSKSAGYPFQVVQTSWSGEQFELPREGEPRIALRAWTTEEASQRLVALSGRTLADLTESAKRRDFRPVPLGIITSLALDSKVRRAQTANVLGLLRGSDPTLREQVVVYTAHHDHLGVGTPDARGDRIYNGAVDNGAGLAQVLGIAHALKALPSAPRRSSLILFVGAEEQGLLGSRYYATHPTFAPGAIAADVNYDFGNVWGKTRDISFVGMEKSSLGALVSRVAAVQGRRVLPDPMPDRGHYYRSDHFSFARIGVPAASFSEGLDLVDRPPGTGKALVEAYEAERYHQPSDEYDPSWNLDGMADDARLGFWVGVTVANEDALPTWTPGDEFEGARKQALEVQR